MIRSTLSEIGRLLVIAVLTALLPLMSACSDDVGDTGDGGDNPICYPSCVGRICGDNGCGGSCGTCREGFTCMDGTCLVELADGVSCNPKCAGKDCGPDSCGGSCGTCPQGTACDEGKCIPFSCVPDCLGKNCGSDSCGGSCGQCPPDKSCISGICITGPCQPNCAGKECGDDGCGESCGDCSPPDQCIDGKCMQKPQLNCDDGNQVPWDGCNNGTIAEFQMNSYAGLNQWNHDSCILSTDSYVVVWANEGQSGVEFSVQGQRFKYDGSLIGQEFQVGTYPHISQAFPAVAALGDGGFLVLWERVSAATGADIFCKAFTGPGATPAAEFQVNQKTPLDQRRPAAAPVAANTVAAVWTSSSQDGSGTGVFGRLIGPEGDGQSEFQVNTTSALDQSAPAIAPLADGGFVVTWQSIGQDGDAEGIFFQRFLPGGQKNGGETQANSYSSGKQIFPSVALLNDGKVAIAWTSKTIAGPGSGIIARIFDAKGVAVSAEISLSNANVQFERGPAVAPLSSGGFAVAWTALDDGSGEGILMQRLDSQGNPSGDKIGANSYIAGNQAVPCLLSMPQDVVLVSWESYAQDGNGWGVFGQRFDQNDNRLYR